MKQLPSIFILSKWLHYYSEPKKSITIWRGGRNGWMFLDEQPNNYCFLLHTRARSGTSKCVRDRVLCDSRIHKFTGLIHSTTKTRTTKTKNQNGGENRVGRSTPKLAGESRRASVQTYVCYDLLRSCYAAERGYM
jgi:hypothetical protein